MYRKICEILNRINLNVETGVITTPKGGNGTTDTTGYIVFKMNKTKFQLHQVLAVIHFGEDCIGMTVNHINGNKKDNSPINLELMTASENSKHEHRTGLARYTNREKLRKKVRQYDSTGNLIAEFESMREAEKNTGVPASYISRACRKNIRASGFVWNFA